MLSLNPSRRDMSGAETKACRPSREPRVAPCRMREAQENLNRSITSDLVSDDLDQIYLFGQAILSHIPRSNSAAEPAGTIICNADSIPHPWTSRVSVSILRLNFGRIWGMTTSFVSPAPGRSS